MTHAVPRGQPAAAGQCRWTYHWEDVELRCTELSLPGSHLCADHLIEKERRRHP